MSVETVYGLYETAERTKRHRKASISKNFVLPLELMENWRNCSVVSDLVAEDYASNCINKNHAKNILSSITNELLENAVKFSYDKNKLVTLCLDTYGYSLTIETTNISKESDAKSLKKFVLNLQTKDLDTLYFEQLERSLYANDNASGLGFLSLMKDYDVSLGIKIERRVTSSRRQTNRVYDVYVKVCVGKNQLATA